MDGAEFAPIKEGEPISMADLMAGGDEDEDLQKRPTGSPGVDWVFDGGLPKFGQILLAAPAGAGKTTWLWGLMHKLSVEQKEDTFYNSTEQDERGLKRQFKRLGLKPTERMIVLAQDDKDSIILAIEKHNPKVFVLDSIHDVEHVTDESGFNLASGQPTAIARVAKELRKLTAEMNFLSFLIGHMTNDGGIKGGSHLRHEVDATLRLDYFTNADDPRRVLYFEKKSRFGPVGRRALFRMGEKGMIDCGPLTTDALDVDAQLSAARDAAQEEAAAEIRRRRAPDELPSLPTGKKPRGVN